MRLKQISLSRLLKSELYAMVDDVIRIMQRHDSRTLHIEESYKMLLRHQPLVNTLGAQYGPCFFVQEQRKIHIKRLEYAGSIFNQVQNIARIKGKSMKREVSIAKIVVRLHFFGIRKKNRPTVNGHLWGFFKAIDEDPEVKNAFEVLGLLSYVEDLREINNLYHEFQELKMDARATRQKSYVNKRIQKKGQDILRIFFAHLEHAGESYPELNDDYTRLYNDLNLLIPKYTKLIRTRATLNKKRAAAKAKADADAKAKQYTLIVNGKETGSVTIGDKKKSTTKKESIAGKGKKG